MTNEKTESSSEIAERLAKILNNQCPVIADGESYGIEPRRAALIIAPIVRAAIEAAVARAIEDKDAEIANTIPHHQHREIMRALRETSLKAVGHLQAEVERLQADLAKTEARADRLYADGMIAHRWFGERFGEELNGRDFAAKRPMADDLLASEEIRRAESLVGMLAAAEQRGREAEREECARHFERGSQFLSFREEQVRYREIAATIRSRGTNSNEPKG